MVVANLSPGNRKLDGYEIRATCLNRTELPCPRPLPDHAECSNPVDTANTTTDTNGECLKVCDVEAEEYQLPHFLLWLAMIESRICGATHGWHENFVSTPEGNWQLPEGQ